jgi:hypothetical protein
MSAIRNAFLVLTSVVLVVLVLLSGQQVFMPVQASATPVLEPRVQALETTVAVLRRDHAALATQVAQLASTPTPPAAKLLPTPTPRAAATDAPLFAILSVDGRVTESNEVWWKYAYIVALQNTSTQRLLLNATVEFLDADGFVVDDERVYDFLLEPGETRSMTGYALIDAGVAGDVDSINAKVGVTAAE